MKQIGSVEVPQEAFMAVLKMDEDDQKNKQKTRQPFSLSCFSKLLKTIKVCRQ